MFKISVIGNIGSDAKIQDSNGRKFISFSVAHSERWTDEQGQEHSNLQWIDCIMNNADSAVFKYLKAGVKVYVRGNAALRVYSSSRDRQMKAGVTVRVQDIELCGGVSDVVPSELINPETGAIVKVDKFYHTPVVDADFKNGDTLTFVSKHGNRFCIDKNGWVYPFVDEEPAEEKNEESKSKESGKDNGKG